MRLHCTTKQNILPCMFQTRVVAAASKTKDVKCRSNSSVRAAKLVVCRKSRLPQAERPAVMNYTSNEGSLHQSTPGNLYITAFFSFLVSVFTSHAGQVFLLRHNHIHCQVTFTTLPNLSNLGTLKDPFYSEPSYRGGSLLTEVLHVILLLA